MIPSEIYQEISRCEIAIIELQSEIVKLRGDEEQLDKLIDEVRKLQTDFANRQEERISKLEAYNDFYNMTCGRKYCEGMLSFLKNHEFMNIYNELEDDIEKMRIKQFEIENIIEEKYSAISVYNQKIYTLRSTLSVG